MRYLLVMLLTTLPLVAQDSSEYRVCDKNAKSQMEMNSCANEEAARVDSELNSVYRKLLSQTTSQPGATAKIKSVEKAWIAYRDAYIDAMYPSNDKLAEYGSVYPMEVELLRAKLTNRQVKAVKELLDQYSPSKPRR
jgi:uncharacterized protein YecT (DUF1311 family)